MKTLNFTALENGITISENGSIRVGHCNSNNYSAIIVVKPESIVESIVNNNCSNYTATLGIFISRCINGTRQTIYFYVGNTNIYTYTLTNSDFISVDLTQKIAAEVQKYENNQPIDDITISVSLSITGTSGSEVADSVDSYIDIYTTNNVDILLRPNLGIKKAFDLDIRKNTNFLVDSPFIGGTYVDSLNSRIRHNFSLFKIEANTLSFDLALLYDSYYKENQSSRPHRYSFGPGINLNIEEYIIKPNNYAGNLGNKNITFYDSMNNKIEFEQKWYYGQGENKTFFDPNDYNISIDFNQLYIIKNGFPVFVYYCVTNYDDSLRYYGKDFTLNGINRYDKTYDLIVDENETKYCFDTNGNLVKILDVFGNEIEITSSSINTYGKINNQRTKIEQVDIDSSGLCNSIGLYAKNGNQSIGMKSYTLDYDYNGNNELIEITHMIENSEWITLNISYNQSGKLFNIISSIPYSLSLDYYQGKIYSVILSSRINTISTTITNQSTDELLYNYRFYSLGNISKIKDLLNNCAYLNYFDVNSCLLKTDSMDYDLLVESHSYKEDNINNLPLSLFSYDNKTSNLVKTFTLNQSSFSELAQIVTFGSTDPFKKRETFIAVLDLSDVDDSFLLNNDIEFIVTTYIEFGMPSKIYKTKYKSLFNSKIGALFCFKKEEEAHFEFKIKSSSTINYNSNPVISVYKCSGSRYEYDDLNRVIRTDSNDNTAVYSYDDNTIIPISSATFDDFTNSHSVLYTKDSNTNQVLSTTDSNGFVKTNSYDTEQLINTEEYYHSSNTNLKTINRYGSENGKVYQISSLKNNDGVFVNAKNTYYYNTNFVTKEKLFNGFNIEHTRNNTTLNTTAINIDSTLLDSTKYNYNHTLLTGVSSYGNDSLFEYWYDNKLRRKRIYLPNYSVIIKEYTDNFNYPSLDIVNGSKIKTNYPNNYSETSYFDKQGKIRKIERTSTNYINFTYNTKDLLSNVFAYHTMESFNYSYDNYDRLTNFTRTTNGQYPLSESNTYVNDKLTGVLYDIDGVTSSESYSYFSSPGYNHNLISNTNSSNKIDTYYSYDTLRRLTSKTTRRHSSNTIIGTNTYSYTNVPITDASTNSLSLISSDAFNLYGDSPQTLIYDYDVMGNIKSIRLNSNLVREYEYDALNRINTDKDWVNYRKTIYTYDSRGNIITKKIETIPTSGSPITLSQTNYSYNNNLWKDLLTSDGTYNYTYDSLGRMTSYKGSTLFWNNNGTLSSISSIASYSYDAFKVRKTKIVGNTQTQYYYIGDKLLRESSPNKDLVFYYNGDDVIGFKYNYKDYMYRKNIQGDILEIYEVSNSTTTKVAEYSYDAFGLTTTTNLNSDNIGTINPFRYRSYYYDEESGLYYLITRYYSPYIMRFISPDSLSYISDNIGDINVCNLYVYCRNNPIMNADPNGKYSILSIIIGLGFGAFSGFLSATINDFFDNKKVDNSVGTNTYAKYIIAGAVGGIISGFTFDNKILDISFNIFAGVVENAINGGFVENGVCSTLISIALSTIISTFVGRKVKSLFAKNKANYLVGLKNHSKVNTILRNMGINQVVGKKSVENLAELIRTTNGVLLNILSEGISSGLANMASSSAIEILIEVLK